MAWDCSSAQVGQLKSSACSFYSGARLCIHRGTFCTISVELPFSGYLKHPLKRDVLLKQTKHPVTETPNPSSFHAVLRLRDPSQPALLGGHPASAEGTLCCFVQDGVCVKPTPWLGLVGVLCGREQPGSQGLNSLVQGSWFRQRRRHRTGNVAWGNWEM